MLRRKIMAAPSALLDRPGIGSPAGHAGIRKWPVKGTRFLLLYHVLRDGTLEILRVCHTAQDWRSE
jgi:plasmid stabilization system protein ParE